MAYRSEKNNFYIVYDTQENELPVMVGYMYEICRDMKISKQLLSYHCIHHTKLHRRYLIEKVVDENE